MGTSVETQVRNGQSGAIEEVPEPTHEPLKNVYACWIAKRGFRIAPPWSVMQLEGEMAALLPDIALIDVVGDLPRFRFRFCGTKVVEAYGGTVCVTGMVDGISTTGILASLARGETAHSVVPTSHDVSRPMRRAG